MLMAKIGDEIVITHPRIESVSKVLETHDEIRVLVKDLPQVEGKKSMLSRKKEAGEMNCFISI